MRVGASDVIRRNLDRPLEVAPHDADQARLVRVRRQGLGVGLQIVDQPAEHGIDEPLMREPAQHRRLAAARRRTTGRHVRSLVPGQHRARSIEIVNLQEPALELREFHFGRPAGVARSKPLRFGCVDGGVRCFCRLARRLPGFGRFSHVSMYRFGKEIRHAITLPPASRRVIAAYNSKALRFDGGPN